MRIVFVSNYINHHQTPLSDRLYELTGGNYTFIQTEPMEQERVNMGWDSALSEKPYVKLYYREKELCDELINTSECVIFGGCEDSNVIMPRLEAGKFTLVYSERIYKTGRWKFISPRGLKKKYHDHTRFNKAPVYLLCAGAHVKGDFDLIGAYKNKKLKFGYFPRTEKYENLHELRKNTEPEILWAGRFIDWKHPEVMIKLAKKLAGGGYKFHMTMIGVGPMLDDMKALAKKEGVSSLVDFPGSKTPAGVRLAMRHANIFVSTSDRQEGWGAVVNEAMNSGCAVVAPRQIGSAPYLIRQGVNGFLYKACSVAELFDITEKLLLPAASEELGNEAYRTIVNTWNADIAAERIYEFARDRELPHYGEGPLSRA